MELAAAPQLAFTVHQNLFVLQQVTGLAAGIDQVGELQQLPEPDRVAADGNFASLHVESVACYALTVACSGL